MCHLVHAEVNRLTRTINQTRGSVKIHTAVLFLLSIISGTVLAAGENQIVNGTFTSDSGWNELGRYNDGDASDTIEGNAYIIRMLKPGTELWSVQLTQSRLKLQNNAAYVLSFEISASLERTIEVTISRNGGDYVSYSGKDTVVISPTRKTVTVEFVMKQPTDNDARLEFNCGKGEGTIAIRNVQLVQKTEKVLLISSPKADELLFLGQPYVVVWSAVNISGKLLLEYSSDNGSTWLTIDTVAHDSNRYVWVPEVKATAWGKLRLSTVDTPVVAVVTQGNFELVPSRELIRNGSFMKLDTGWAFSKHNGKAETSITGYGGYQITIIQSGSEHWNMQMIQDKLLLKKGNSYQYSFLAFASKPTVVDVNIGMSHDPYTSYLDSTHRIINLTTTPTRYSFVFTMTQFTDSSARFEVNCGKAEGDLFFDDFSLMQQYVAPVVHQSNMSRAIPEQSSGVKYGVRLGGAGRTSSYDLLGRMRLPATPRQGNAALLRRSASSGYFITPSMSDRKHDAE